MGDKAALLARRRMMEEVKKVDDGASLEENRIQSAAATFGGLKAAAPKPVASSKPSLARVAEQSPGMSSPFTVGNSEANIVNPAIPAELAAKISARRKDVDQSIQQSNFQNRVAAASSGDDDFKRMMEASFYQLIRRNSADKIFLAVQARRAKTDSAAPTQ